MLTLHLSTPEIQTPPLSTLETAAHRRLVSSPEALRRQIYSLHEKVTPLPTTSIPAIPRRCTAGAAPLLASTPATPPRPSRTQTAAPKVQKKSAPQVSLSGHLWSCRTASGDPRWALGLITSRPSTSHHRWHPMERQGTRQSPPLKEMMDRCSG